MDFLTSTKPYFWFFHYIGLSFHLPGDDQSKGSKSVFIQMVPVLIHSAVGILMSIWIIIILLSSSEPIFYGRTEATVINTMAICETSRSIFILVECLFHKQYIFEIVKTFQKLETFFAIHLQHRILYKNFHKIYLTKVSLLAGIYFQYLIIFILRSFAYKMLTPHGIQVKILQIQTASTFLQIIFYIEMLNFYVEQLNVVISNDIDDNFDDTSSILLVRNTRNNHHIRSKLNYLKTIHFRLWEVSRKINAYFGWSMVALYMHSFIGIVHSAYWLFDSMQRPWAPLTFLRE